MFIHSITPVPLLSGHFDGLTGLGHQIVKGIYLGQGGLRNHCHNNRRQNRPNQFQRSVVIKTLRDCLYSVMKALNNTSSQPQYQYQNNNLEKTDVSMQICNSFHVGSCRVLKQLLPCYRSISSNYTPIPYHTQHCTHFFFQVD